jgi:hypothetical protein
VFNTGVNGKGGLNQGISNCDCIGVGQVQHMRNFSDRCGHVSRMFSIGKSSKGLDLWALEISQTAGVRDAKPNVKYVANMHGDEPTGRYGDLVVC